MSNPEQLSSVITAFEQWRHHKNGRQTPALLRQQAVALLDNYSSSRITSALRISGTQLKQWTESLQVVNKPAPFVHLPLSSSVQHKSLNLELHFRHGEQLTLCGDISLSLITAMIQEMKS
ncbi:hypothetical protein [Psychromonas antarctica]|uniref:hypothetical protein n=1 Tax=Psychromonas antarctica TaxID=67573 RepID=UPI001EE8A4DB|nr:hypothetical protein [Psychromonas antarctica]MCG6200562.1 hypothetical protein [Psychromonas antarctica]